MLRTTSSTIAYSSMLLFGCLLSAVVVVVTAADTTGAGGGSPAPDNAVATTTQQQGAPVTWEFMKDGRTKLYSGRVGVWSPRKGDTFDGFWGGGRYDEMHAKLHTTLVFQFSEHFDVWLFEYKEDWDKCNFDDGNAIKLAEPSDQFLRHIAPGALQDDARKYQMEYKMDIRRYYYFACSKPGQPAHDHCINHAAKLRVKIPGAHDHARMTPDTGVSKSTIALIVVVIVVSIILCGLAYHRYRALGGFKGFFQRRSVTYANMGTSLTENVADDGGGGDADGHA